MRTSLLFSLALLACSACGHRADTDDAGPQLVHLDPESVKDIARAVGGNQSPKMGATSSSPNFNVTDFQNQMVLNADIVTWVADGGTYSDGGPRLNVSAPSLLGTPKTVWFDCGGNSTAWLYVDWFNAPATYQHAGPFPFPCNTSGLPDVISTFYQDGTDAGSVTIYRGM